MVLLEVRLVDGLLDLDLPDLLDLVEVDEKRLPLVSCSMKALLRVGSRVWRLVAHKSKDIALLTFLKPDIFYISKLLEQLSELPFTPRNWEVFDEEIAPLLGDLVLECLSFLLDLSICPLHSVADIQLVVLGDLLVVENFDCTCSAPWPVPKVILIWIIIAHESELADVVLSQDQRLDGTELLEESLDLVVAPVEWEVLDVDIVDQVEDISSLLWLELHGHYCLIFCRILDCLLGIFFLLKAYEPIASRRVI